MLSERVLHDWQNHLLPDDKISRLGNCLREVCMSVDTCRDSISRFSSVVLSALEIKLHAANDTPLS